MTTTFEIRFSALYKAFLKEAPEASGIPLDVPIVMQGDDAEAVRPCFMITASFVGATVKVVTVNIELRTITGEEGTDEKLAQQWMQALRAYLYYDPAFFAWLKDQSGEARGGWQLLKAPQLGDPELENDAQAHTRHYLQPLTLRIATD